MSTITVAASRWEHGWELEIDADHHTQVATLDQAPRQVRDYLDTTFPEVDHSGWEVDVRVELADGLADEVAAARQATEKAAEAAVSAGRQSRRVVKRLRAAGLSVTDAAAILGVSRGRISQLTKKA